MKKLLFVALSLLIAVNGFGQGSSDLGIARLISPVSSGTLGATEFVSILIVNEGTTPQGSFTVSYSVNGSPSVVESVATTLPPGGSMIYTFSTPVNMSPYVCYSLEACLQPDSNPANDCLYENIIHFTPGFVSDTIYPHSFPYATGSTNGQTFTQSSSIHIAGNQAVMGWASFDLSGIPAGASLVYARLRLYNTQVTAKPILCLRRVTVNLLGSAPSQVYSNISNGAEYLRYSFPLQTNQFMYFELPHAAIQDINANIVSTALFTLGFSDASASATSQAYFDGWQATGTKPYIIVYYYNGLFQHDAGVISVDVDTNLLPAVCVPTVTVTNTGLNAETFSVSLQGSNGYSEILTVNNLNPGNNLVLSFPVIPAPQGSFCLTARTNLSTDMYCRNDVMTSCIHVSQPVAVVQGQVTYANQQNSVFSDSTEVILMPLNPPGPPITVPTGTNGQYFFSNMAAGDYLLFAQTQKSWGGGNSVDALLILYHFLGMQSLTGLHFQAADVNADNAVNAIDAMQVAQRFVGMINGFAAGDWIFSQLPLSIAPGQQQTVNLQGICTGDVDGSHIP